MSSSPGQNPRPQQSHQSNPAVTELMVIRKELESVRNELSKLRIDLKDKNGLNISDQVMIGVLKAILAVFLLSILFQILGSTAEMFR